MLDSIDLKQKSYEKSLSEAISRIPLYTEEWTNFNRSEPAITILQNLTSFNYVQQNRIYTVTEQIYLKLLKLVGLEPGKAEPARVFLEVRGDEPIFIPANMKFFAGGLQFETEREIRHEPWGVEAVYSLLEGKTKDITYLLNREMTIGAAVFGEEAKKGSALVLLIGDYPKDGEPLILWTQASQNQLRVPFEATCPVSFAKLLWEIYTQDGWKPVKSFDTTHNFLTSGIIQIDLGDTKPELYTGLPKSGYALRCTLKESFYDMPPQIRNISTNLICVSQKRTCAASFSFKGEEEILLQSELVEQGNLFVYCREGEEDAYRVYQKMSQYRSSEGRYYTIEEVDHVTVRIQFDRDRFGYGPSDEEDAVLVICYENEALFSKDLGQVYGYEDQEIEINQIKNIIADEFALLAEVEDADGVPEYHMIFPDSQDPDELCYEVDEKNGTILVRHAGVGDSCKLYLADCATTEGGNGRVRPNNQFLTQKKYPVSFHNPGESIGGALPENTKELRQRFLTDLRRPSVAVTSEDYEAMVKRTPGLCIHKVRAASDESRNLIRISVKPQSKERYPTLSSHYYSQIRRYLEPRRMITTRVELVQPKYIPVNVHLSVCVKSYADNVKRQLEEMLEKELDFASTGKEFGETLYYHRIFRMVEEQPGVDVVLDFSMTPQGHIGVSYSGADINFGFDCFCRPGIISIETISKDSYYR